jgi:hypothetical protein
LPRERRLIFQPTGEGFPANIMDDGARGVVAAGIVAAGLASSIALLPLEDESFKDVAQHFGVDGDFHAGGGVLDDGEVISVEQFLEDGAEDGIGNIQGAAALDVRIVRAGFIAEQAAIEERHIVREGGSEAGLGAEALEERAEEAAEERAAGLIRVGLEGILEEGAAAVQPAFPLDEVEEDEAVQQGLGLGAAGIASPVRMGGFQLGGDLADTAGEVVEKVRVELFDGESINEIRKLGSSSQFEQ